jgi:hypothetical protein
LRGALFSSLEAPAGSQLAELVSLFERYSSEADQLADHAVSDAKRVAAHAVQTRRLEEERSKEAGAKKRIALLEDRQHEILKAWTAAWDDTGIAPSHSSEMASWRLALQALLDRREKLENQRDEIAEIEATIRNIEPALRALAAEVGLREIEQVGVALVAKQIEDRLQTLVESWDKGRDLEARIRDTQRRIDEFIAIDADAKRSVKEWSARWGVALPAIGLPAIATIEEAQAALSVWNEVPGAIRERNNRARRVAGMQRNLEAFEREVKDLVREIGPDLATLPPDAAVKMLNDRLTAARAAESRRTETQRRLVDTTRARQEADTALSEAEATLAILTAQLPSD